MWEELVKNHESLVGFGGGRKISVTEGKKPEDYIDAISRAYLTTEDNRVLKINANSLHIGGHVHLGVDEGIGESWMDRRRINPDISSIVSSIGINTLNATSVVTIQGKVHRECPPNKVVKYTQLVWKSGNSARDNLAVMSVNEYYAIVAPTNRGYLSNTRTSTTIEIWFEDDHHFHVYENDVRVFQSKSAKATANFLETGEK
ncbi:hypothetical protein [Acinetobacter phage vB_AbaP_HB01]|nr:hypothetical protein [Acinetobacter phage vB_AbaP_HB01]